MEGSKEGFSKPGPAPYLSKAEESELPAHLVHVANMGYGKTQRDMKCVCFGNYNDDLDTTREWLQCKCDRWMHEDCIDVEDCIITERELCPLC